MRYITYLAVALDLQELEDFKLWSQTRDPKKFPWSTPDRAGLLPGGTSQKAIDIARSMHWGSRVQRSAWEFAQATGKKVVFEAMKWDSATGKPIGKVYVDVDGNEVDLGAQVYVPMIHPDVSAMADRVFGRRAV